MDNLWNGLRWIRYILEAVVLLFGIVLFRILPLDIASYIGGRLARSIGPLLQAHFTAERNLEYALPQTTGTQRSAILVNMWDNLGRTIGEYPHLSTARFARRIRMEQTHYMDDVKSSGKGALFASGHFANWEIGPLSAAIYGMPLAVIYRPPNNPFCDWLIRYIRGAYSLALYPKGSAGAKKILRTIKEGHSVAILLDQKMNDGSAVTFFGHSAMTTTAPISIAIKLRIPVLPVRIVRQKGVRFTVRIDPPRYYDAGTDPVEAMRSINELFEAWITEYPSQWLWVHNRWGKYKSI